MGVDDAAVLDAEVVQVRLPLLELGAIGAAEGDVVETGATLLEWLGGLPFVDAQRIGFYGLSYGGKTAVRIPPLLPGRSLAARRS